MRGRGGRDLNEVRSHFLEMLVLIERVGGIFLSAVFGVVVVREKL